ncbi:MAG TPA: hypothetical protein VNB64_06575 [Solirubrobacteraceae bacterium]|nr:hypothetical protein [Solirubrobacteraceae bacterium]
MKAIRWGLPRLALVLGAIIFIPIFAYSVLIAVIVVRQALTGQ